MNVFSQAALHRLYDNVPEECRVLGFPMSCYFQVNLHVAGLAYGKLHVSHFGYSYLLQIIC
jgi:hypothetical protein